MSEKSKKVDTERIEKAVREILIAVGEEWKKRVKPTSDCPIEVITYVKSPSEQSTHY